MKIFQKHEEFEMLTLDTMRRARILDQLIFGGGTMLRLCFDLPRYSVDFDFYLGKNRRSFLPWARKLGPALTKMGAEITDKQEKHFSFLWEIRMSGYPRRLKIEVRKKSDQAKKTQLTIAHSPYSNYQVRLKTLTMEQMWWNKIKALADRGEARDAYDLEFLSRCQIVNFGQVDKELLRKIIQRIESFTNEDFKSKLGPVLQPEERKVVLSNRFAYLKSKILSEVN